MWDVRGMAVVKMKHYEAGRSQDERLKLVTSWHFCLILRRTRFNDTLIHCVLDLMSGLSRMAQKINGKVLISSNKFMEENHLLRPPLLYTFAPWFQLIICANYKLRIRIGGKIICVWSTTFFLRFSNDNIVSSLCPLSFHCTT